MNKESKTDPGQQRQGDIFFQEVDAPPAGSFKIDDPVLAYGEVTGHSHRILNPEGVIIHKDDNSFLYLYHPTTPIEIVHGGATLADSEHSPITLAPGKWHRVEGQREYDPAAVARERRVAD